MAQPAVEIDGLREFRSELRAAGKEWPKELKSGYRKISEHLADKAQGRARSLGGVHAKAAGKIRAQSTATEASVGVRSGGIGSVAFFGAKRHTGWYARKRYADSPPQHPKWVGNDWDAGVAGQGPYAINDAVAAETEYIERAFLDVVDDVMKRAFPDR